MAEEINENGPEAFASDIDALVDRLKAVLGEGASRWHYDEPSETLYVELASITNQTEEEIWEKATPVIDRSELDFEEIILLPYAG